MKFPYSMLLEFVQTKLDAHRVGALLTMAGFELEGIEQVEEDQVLDIKVVSNRGDGLSVFGLAREVLAKDVEASPSELYARAAGRFPGPSKPTPRAPEIAIRTESCSRYAYLLLENTLNGESPPWLQRRIRQAGWRPLSLLVDLGNYVMLELGQPVHAFDFDKLEGREISVREARAGERLVTLNGQEHELSAGQMVICDSDRPVALAGVMGGLDTEVDAGTTRVLVESAHFAAGSVRRTRKQLGLTSEAAYRFERSVDPDGVVGALNRYAELLAACAGGAQVCGLADCRPVPPRRPKIDLRVSRAQRLLGTPVEPEEAARYLDRLGFEVEGDGEPFHVAVPSWRPDVVREDDLVEEVGRVHGYDRIPETPLEGTTLLGGVFGMEAFLDRLREAVVRAGFVQTISHSLSDRHPLDEPASRAIELRNPGSPEMSRLRSSLLPSLSDAALRNGGRNLHLFEIGAVFPGGEHRALGLLSQGRLYPAAYAAEKPPVSDFFSLKGVLQECLRSAGAEVQIREGAGDPRLHPTRQAACGPSSGACGVIGQIHPDVAEELDLPLDTILAEVALDEIAGEKRVVFRHVSRNPAIRRDIAILISKEMPYERLEAAARLAAGEDLEKLWLFDVYEGQGIPEGHHSLAIGMQLRKAGDNLTDEEANQVRDEVLAALESLGAKQR